MECCEIRGVFGESNLIKQYKHWRLLVRYRNTTLGNCVAITNGISSTSKTVFALAPVFGRLTKWFLAFWWGFGCLTCGVLSSF